jgi:hypothetical protein
MTMKNLGSEAGGVSRRDALKAFGAAGAAGAMLSANHLFGQQVNKSTAKGGRIDVHHHHAPPALETGPGRAGRAPWTPEHAEYIPNGTYTELKKFYFDVAHASFPMPLAALLKFASEDHILFGTNFSPEPVESTVNELATLGLPPKLMAAIERGNTEKLFPRFKV